MSGRLGGFLLAVQSDPLFNVYWFIKIDLPQAELISIQIFQTQQTIINCLGPDELTNIGLLL